MICPRWWAGRWVGRRSSSGLHPSWDTEPIMCFMVSSRANVGPARLISSMFTLFLSLMVTLISHPTPAPPSPLSSMALNLFPNTPSSPRLCFLHSSLFLSTSPPTPYLIAFVPSLLFSSAVMPICLIPVKLFPFRCLPISPIGLFPGGVSRCDGMMSEEPSACQLGQSHGRMSKTNQIPLWTYSDFGNIH